MTNFDKLLKNEDIRHYYSLTKQNMGYYVEHNLNHALRVVETARALAIQLNLNANDIDNVCCAAILHDVGASNFGKNEHAERSFKIAKKYTANEKILNAIRYHSEGHPSDYGYILTLADKLDICRERVTNLGKTVLGVRQWTHLVSMEFTLTDKLLCIKFTSDGELNMKELNEYYFTQKIFNSIKNFTNYFGLKYKVFIDNHEWF